MGIVLPVAVLALFGLLLVRPTPSPKSAVNSLPEAETPTVSSEAPNQSFSAPSAPSEQPIDDLLVLDQPTEQSSPQPDAAEQGGSEPTSAFSVRILNGGGRAGAAASLKADLEAAGYTVLSIGTARSTYAQTTLYYQVEFKQEASTLADALGEPTPTVEESGIAAPADILIVIGSDRP